MEFDLVVFNVSDYEIFMGLMNLVFMLCVVFYLGDGMCEGKVLRLS